VTVVVLCAFECPPTVELEIKAIGNKGKSS
jgi:hypothetical protein